MLPLTSLSEAALESVDFLWLAVNTWQCWLIHIVWPSQKHAKAAAASNKQENADTPAKALLVYVSSMRDHIKTTDHLIISFIKTSQENLVNQTQWTGRNYQTKKNQNKPSNKEPGKMKNKLSLGTYKKENILIFCLNTIAILFASMESLDRYFSPIRWGRKLSRVL